uniref:Uncharacterized protein n=1 Tax=Oryza meridionalis TaxID=40149 RepID=A0A0E0ERQ6_9ORYZ
MPVPATPPSDRALRSIWIVHLFYRAGASAPVVSSDRKQTGREYTNLHQTLASLSASPAASQARRLASSFLTRAGPLPRPSPPLAYAVIVAAATTAAVGAVAAAAAALFQPSLPRRKIQPPKREGSASVQYISSTCKLGSASVQYISSTCKLVVGSLLAIATNSFL